MMRGTLYSKIVEEMKAKIASGAYRPDEQLPTEAELTERFGVSRVTSRRALEELEKLGYIYRIQGSGSFVKPLSRLHAEQQGDRVGKMVSLILPEEDDRGAMGYIRGASDWLNRHGYFLSVHQSNYDNSKERKLLEELPRRGVAAIIYYPRTPSHFDVLHKLALEDYPLVTIDKSFESLSIGSVVSDNFDGAYQAVSHLIALGHRRIGFLSSVSIELTSSVLDRYFGYCQALKDGGIPVDSRFVHLDARMMIEERGRERFFEELLQLYISEGITAVQTENDLVAASLLNSCLDAGLRVPQDLSIIGYDNHALAEHVAVPLTTVEQNFYEIGRRAAEMVVAWLEQGTACRDKMTVPVKLVRRESAAGTAPEARSEGTDAPDTPQLAEAE
ncbi:GntR family transcriptional regulator [Paenibacillus sp. A14]|uniref:GntR family transcriptional regulator n=1 Tax=Paenibacillus sp. A14 TaxID=3119820 RepID=UPI002FE128A6